ncbi:LRR receptor-like serine/threonine-protein kinase GSO1 [Pyrus ussuriensis x Pyrus communis]|uniref:LRR receptor-like serine/threonine-protein kinase GSO1 n=1 Tax=Pyrus ussuriensis x Pyrus communis TaxID=2448454 RepID=A0A5N5I4K0_9ROSA|nr:LRR receptor-like serine/threonine-protein kinase GSO1 [Pyrus ussuriensis x Pyrus communis]
MSRNSWCSILDINFENRINACRISVSFDETRAKEFTTFLLIPKTLFLLFPLAIRPACLRCPHAVQVRNGNSSPVAPHPQHDIKQHITADVKTTGTGIPA